MFAVNENPTSVRWHHLLLALLLASVTLPGLSACGKKGPLYHPTPEQQSEKK